MTYMNSVRTSAECGYLRGQVDRLQHEVDVLEIGILIIFGLLTVTVAALLMSLERNWRTGRPGKPVVPELGTSRAAFAPLKMETPEQHPNGEEESKP